MSTKKLINAKQVLVDYYDSLIRQIDIYTEELLENYSEDDVIQESSDGDETSSQVSRLAAHYEIRPSSFIDSYGISSFVDSNSHEFNYDWTRRLRARPGRTKIVDYLNSIRDEMIDALQKAQTHNYECLRSNKNAFKINETEEEEEEIKRKIFANKFCFLLKIDEVIILANNFPKIAQNMSIFKYYLFVVDFYMSREDFQTLR